jgi:hypothetical protein
MNDTATFTSRRADTAAVLFALGFPTLITWIYFTLLADCDTVIMGTVFGLGKVAQFSFPLVWVLALQRRRPDVGTVPIFVARRHKNGTVPFCPPRYLHPRFPPRSVAPG